MSCCVEITFSHGKLLAGIANLILRKLREIQSSEDGVRLPTWWCHWKRSLTQSSRPISTVPVLVYVRVWVHILRCDPQSVQPRNVTTLTSIFILSVAENMPKLNAIITTIVRRVREHDSLPELRALRVCNNCLKGDNRRPDSNSPLWVWWMPANDSYSEHFSAVVTTFPCLEMKIGWGAVCDKCKTLSNNFV